MMLLATDGQIAGSPADVNGTEPRGEIATSRGSGVGLSVEMPRLAPKSGANLWAPLSREAVHSLMRISLLAANPIDS